MVKRLLTHPRILADTGRPLDGVDAILVDDGRIAALGSRYDLRAAHPGIPELALPGAVLVPGFHDAHIHTGNLARSLSSFDLREADTLDAALDVLRAHLDAHPGDGWVTGGRWDSNRWPTGVPTRHDLDAVCATRPLALPSLDGHSIWLNTRALELAGIDRATPDPFGGDIARESDGETPAGVLRETAVDPVRELSEREQDAALPELLLRAQAHLHALGLTRLTDLDEQPTREAFEALRADDRLRIRVHKGTPMPDLERAIAEGRRTGAGDRWITEGPVKLFSDGALGSHSAHMHTDFADDPGNRGIEVMTVEQIADYVERANAAGLAVATHAIGDEANRRVLDAYERNVALTREHGLRNRIEHAQHLAHEDLRRFAPLGVVASLQPLHCTTDFELAGRRIGERRLANYAWRSFLDAGAILAFGSDAPIEPADVLAGIRAAVTRQRADGTPDGGFEPEERVTAGEALAAYTSGAALAAGLEHRAGRIAVGCDADFVALGADPTVADPETIAAIAVAGTIVDGEVVFAPGG